MPARPRPRQGAEMTVKSQESTERSQPQIEGFRKLTVLRRQYVPVHGETTAVYLHHAAQCGGIECYQAAEIEGLPTGHDKPRSQPRFTRSSLLACARMRNTPRESAPTVPSTVAGTKNKPVRRAPCYGYLYFVERGSKSQVLHCDWLFFKRVNTKRFSKC